MINLGNYNENVKAGGVTATTTATSLADLASLSAKSSKINGVCFIQVTGSVTVVMQSEDSSDGILLPADNSILPVYVDDLSKIILKASSSTSAVKFWAY